jgi:DNA polymerase III subunit beta
VKTSSEVAAIIPVTTLQEVLRTLNDEVDQVDVLFDETQVRFRLGESEVISRLIDGNFPDYRQLIPAKSEISITANKADFVRIVKIASLFARESGGSITLASDADKKTLSIHSIASELGENTSELTVETTSTGQITLNSRYLAEALSVVEDDTISFEFSGKLSPSILKSSKKDTNYYHVIMPLKS